MSILDVYSDFIVDDIIYEDDFMRVTKVLHEIKLSGNYVKRIQLVIWKSKKTDIPDIDFRLFSKNENKYYKGITFSIREAEEIFAALKNFFKDNE